ncbi:Putative metal-binding protein [Ignavibacterium album JCM 16511]|uniref:Putative metal-binding protein n=1 Tax=Ignavibacterium album (strain DSM 19864 / JCM 16511 / NBRC 101810 / Mat9-16) TaxID=945713 RepID=I0AIL2_IGNAJ|nr:CGGC domain-containing protein [Ignavibacterium album]AFH48819.1 Putative metal-binding protein [Ignavibacterium album JCM 16511]
MSEKVKIGIIICDRYKSCAGGKCFRSIKERVGAFDIYKDKDVELVGYTSCGGCPGGNIEYAPEELKKNGAEVIHFATGMVVGYPPCPYIKEFKNFIETKYGLKVVVGTHPIPEKYYLTHTKLETWKDAEWDELLKPTLKEKEIRLAYD